MYIYIIIYLIRCIWVDIYIFIYVHIYTNFLCIYMVYMMCICMMVYTVKWRIHIIYLYETTSSCIFFPSGWSPMTLPTVLRCSRLFLSQKHVVPVVPEPCDNQITTLSWHSPSGFVSKHQYPPQNFIFFLIINFSNRWVFPKKQGYPNSRMIFILENPYENGSFGGYSEISGNLQMGWSSIFSEQKGPLPHQVDVACISSRSISRSRRWSWSNL